MPILTDGALEVFSNSPEQTRRLGMQLGELLAPGDVIWLEGDLGSGKTTLVQGMAAGWGSADLVTSPTFVLVNVYRRPNRQQFAHMDAYRLESAEDAEQLDLDALMDQGPLIVEWAPRIAAALPAERLHLQLQTVDETRRHILVEPHGERYQDIARAFKDAVYGN
ncbi:MAG: tRNA (adenosine(37)-N6)-threonylcarbamoyltransferase complex ATPase subunit type 1 TsaE [Anaerolineales bacterium]|nr:MAG: tRNA (adenosine(37)-N6)-threonylcarbamoyltransferase complex ATPase subunit type 1 TsaE [Anaerolineales bacterium]